MLLLSGHVGPVLSFEILSSLDYPDPTFKKILFFLEKFNLLNSIKTN